MFFLKKGESVHNQKQHFKQNSEQKIIKTSQNVHIFHGLSLPTAPMKLPSHDKVSDFMSCAGCARSSSTAMETIAALPVKSSVPDNKVMKRPKGRPKAPKTNLKFAVFCGSFEVFDGFLGFGSFF